MTLRRAVAVFGAAVLSFALPLRAAGPADRVAAAGVWRPVGPYGGTVTALAVDPSNPASVLAGTQSNGIFHSSNGGATWDRSGPSNTFTLKIVFDPRHRGTAYAGIGNDLVKTADGGQSWTSAARGLPTGEDFYVFEIAVDPRQASTVYAVTSAGLYKTADAAAHWFHVASRFPRGGERAIDSVSSPGGGLAIDPVTATLYLCTDGGLLRSVDGGLRWKSFGPAGVGMTTLALDPGNPDVLYAGGDNGLFRSTDHGGSWRRIGKTLPGLEVTALAVHSGRPSTLVAVFRSSNDHPGGLYRSLDGGSHWEAPPLGLPAGDVLAMAIDSATPPRVYAGVPVLGVYASADAGGHFAAADVGLRAIEVSSVAVDPERPGTAYTAPTEQGVWKTADAGASWQIVDPRMTDIGQLGSSATIALDPQRPATVYAGVPGRLERSDDGGRTWRLIDLGLRRFFPTGALAVDPVDPANLYMATQLAGIFKSTDGGGHWQAPAPLPYCSEGPVPFSLAVSPTAPSEVYVGTAACSALGSDLFKSTDGGSTWIHLDLSLNLLAFALDPTDSRVLYLVDFDSHLVRSTDGGSTFQPLTQPPGAELTAVGVAPSDSRRLYLGAVGAAYSSPDAGATWQQVGGGFDGTVAGLAVDPSTPGRLWVATDNGVFVFDPEVASGAQREAR